MLVDTLGKPREPLTRYTFVILRETPKSSTGDSPRALVPHTHPHHNHHHHHHHDTTTTTTDKLQHLSSLLVVVVVVVVIAARVRSSSGATGVCCW